MKKIIPALICALTCAGAAHADLRVSAASELAGKNLTVEAVEIANLASARSRSELKTTSQSVEIVPNLIVATPGTAPTRYRLSIGDETLGSIYALPTDTVNVSITADGDMAATGTPLLDQIAALDLQLQAPYAAYMTARGANNLAGMEAAADEYDRLLRDYVRANPSLPGAVWAVMQLDPAPMLELAPLLTGDARQSIIYPLLASRLEQARATVEAERRQAAMQNGTTPAPDFTLPAINGKMVSLKDFRGKWVVLDFWGSWCGWCIKGIPAMKEAYAKYKDKVEFIGIDCNDPEANWRAAVKKYQLPWINVYNARTQGGVLEEYGIQGFPSKVIVNPEGVIYKIFEGEDPAFYTALEEALK